MRPQLLAITTFAALAAAAAGCGHEIGDSCTISSECSPNGDRICDISQPGGYCTVIGCDADSCPEESVCVRFFPVGNASISCDPQTEDFDTDACTADELCTLAGYCAPRNAEVRFCMKQCGGGDDCRGEYECRDKDLMIEHGGEPVPPPGEPVDDDPQPFCAVAPI
jgi:hypothetical protein